MTESKIVYIDIKIILITLISVELVLNNRTGYLILFGDCPVVHPKLLCFIPTQKQCAADKTNLYSQDQKNNNLL